MSASYRGEEREYDVLLGRRPKGDQSQNEALAAIMAAGIRACLCCESPLGIPRDVGAVMALDPQDGSEGFVGLLCNDCAAKSDQWIVAAASAQGGATAGHA